MMVAAMTVFIGSSLLSVRQQVGVFARRAPLEVPGMSDATKVVLTFWLVVILLGAAVALKLIE